MRDTESNLSRETLIGLRTQNHVRTKDFLSHYDITIGLDMPSTPNLQPIDAQNMQEHRHRILDNLLPTELPSDYYGSTDSLSLLDTLPLFMTLSAAQNTLQGYKITTLWMRLAARYMAEVVIEQYLIYGANGLEPLEEAFAYGFDSKNIAASGSDDLEIINLFWGGGDEGEIEGWEEIRRDHLCAVRDPD